MTKVITELKMEELKADTRLCPPRCAGKALQKLLTPKNPDMNVL